MKIPFGIIINCLAIFFGALFGALGRQRIPEKIKKTLPMIFASCALSIGIKLIGKVVNLPPVVLSMILGTVIGEFLDLENKLQKLSVKLQTRIQTGITKADEKSIEGFISLFVLFSASATLIIGSLHEGITGDATLLIIKAILDFFTAMIFATAIGYLLLFLSIPPLIVGITLFSFACLIMPIVTEVMIADFTACGGIITLLVGIRMMELKKIPVPNVLPSILLVMPLSYLWTLIF